MRPRTVLASLAVAGLTAGASGAAEAHGPDDVTTARQATAAFHRTAVAEAAGYGLPPAGPLHECIEHLEGHGAMGLHLIHGGLVSDAVLDPARPEALVYEETMNGTKLVALEYVVFQDVWEAEHGATVPELFGRPLTPVGFPNRYEIPAFYQIHVWAWEHNPAGMFADFSTGATCHEH
jgi:hypothetical protein